MTPHPGPLGSTHAPILAITSGKGGVGKTFVAANLAAAFAARGESVLVLDTDLGLANLNVLLNLSPKASLQDVFAARCSLQDAIVIAPGKFAVLFSGAGVVEGMRLTPGLQQRFLAVLDNVRRSFDRVIVDAGAGISDVVLSTLSLADEVLLVTTPDPAALADAYVTVKVLAAVQQRRCVNLVINQALEHGDGGGRSPAVAAGERQVCHAAVGASVQPRPRGDHCR